MSTFKPVIRTRRQSGIIVPSRKKQEAESENENFAHSTTERNEKIQYEEKKDLHSTHDQLKRKRGRPRKITAELQATVKPAEECLSSSQQSTQSKPQQHEQGCEMNDETDSDNVAVYETVAAVISGATWSRLTQCCSNRHQLLKSIADQFGATYIDSKTNNQVIMGPQEVVDSVKAELAKIISAHNRHIAKSTSSQKSASVSHNMNGNKALQKESTNSFAEAKEPCDNGESTIATKCDEAEEIDTSCVEEDHENNTSRAHAVVKKLVGNEAVLMQVIEQTEEHQGVEQVVEEIEEVVMLDCNLEDVYVERIIEEEEAEEDEMSNAEKEYEVGETRHRQEHYKQTVREDKQCNVKDILDPATQCPVKLNLESQNEEKAIVQHDDGDDGKRCLQVVMKEEAAEEETRPPHQKRRRRGDKPSERPVTCPHCQFVASNYSKLSVHIKSYHDEREFTCHICFMKFAYKSLLAGHKKNHLEKDGKTLKQSAIIIHVQKRNKQEKITLTEDEARQIDSYVKQQSVSQKVQATNVYRLAELRDGEAASSMMVVHSKPSDLTHSSLMFPDAAAEPPQAETIVMVEATEISRAEQVVASIPHHLQTDDGADTNSPEEKSESEIRDEQPDEQVENGESKDCAATDYENRNKMIKAESQTATEIIVSNISADQEAAVAKALALKTKRNVKTVMLSCEFCSALLHGPYALKRHVDNFHPPAPILDADDDPVAGSDGGGEAASSSSSSSKLTTMTRHLIALKQPPSASADDMLQCPHCDFKCARIQNFTRHVRNHDNPDLYKCDECDYTNSQRAEVLRHKRNKHGELRHRCEFCGKLFRTAPQLNTHVAARHERRYAHTCETCGVVLSSRRAVQLHRQRRHPGNRLLTKTSITCDRCGRHFDTRLAYNTHLTELHGESSAADQLVNENVEPVAADDGGGFRCRLCTYKNNSAREVRLHIERQHGERDKACTSCDKVFSTELALRKHTDTAHLPPTHNVACGTCGKVFSSLARLKTHDKRVHKGVRKYACEICGRQFAEKSQWLRHVEIHKPEEERNWRFECTDCDKKFRFKCNYELHMKDHAGEFNFPCQVCSKQFKTKTALDAHSATHSDERPFVCAHCNRGFKLKKYLDVHLQAHSADKFVCGACGRLFVSHLHLTRHVCKAVAVPRPQFIPDTAAAAEAAAAIESASIMGQSEDVKADVITQFAQGDSSVVTLCGLSNDHILTLSSGQKVLISGEPGRQLEGELGETAEQLVVEHVEGGDGNSSLVTMAMHEVSSLNEVLEDAASAADQHQMYMCAFCNQMFPSAEDTQQHLVSEHMVQGSEVVTAATDVKAEEMVVEEGQAGMGDEHGGDVEEEEGHIYMEHIIINEPTVSEQFSSVQAPS